MDWKKNIEKDRIENNFIVKDLITMSGLEWIRKDWIGKD